MISIIYQYSEQVCSHFAFYQFQIKDEIILFEILGL